jgi:HK97 gp10 family phage protein
LSLIITGLQELVAALDGAPLKLRTYAAKAVEVTARTIRDDARQRISGHRYLPQYPRSITYDIKPTPGGVEAEIGPDKQLAQGALGNIIEYGTSHNAPLPHLGPALDAAGPDAEHGITTAVQDALL